MKKKQWLVPPGLRNEVEHFESIYNETKTVPLMITGPSGVGKSLFVHLYSCLFKKEHSQKKIVTLNCAAFSKDLLLSELFGHVRGAFTGASQNRKGHIEEADGGLLVLEEIGELPQEGQAQLLTFIEDGYFFKVGSTRREHASIQIICTTNKPKESFREDFWYRFFPYRVKPIHERREDILYYLYWPYPEIVKELMPWEVLSLLCYNWPGNVREIERVGRLIRVGKGSDSGFWAPELPPVFFHQLDRYIMFGKASQHTEIDPFRVFIIRNTLRQSGVDVELLEKTLNKFDLSISPELNKKPAFKNSKEQYNYSPEIEKEFTNEHVEVKTCFDHDFFNGLQRGLLFLVNLFMITRGIYSGKDLLESIEKCLAAPIHEKDWAYAIRTMKLKFVERPSKKHYQLEKQIFEVVTGLHLPAGIDSLPDPYTPEYKHLLSSVREQEIKCGDLTFSENEKKYLKSVIKKAGGNITAAAKLADLKSSTFRDKLKKHGIP